MLFMAPTLLTLSVQRQIEGSDSNAYLHHITLKLALPSSSRCVRLREIYNILTVVPVQPQTCTVATFYVKPSSRSVATLMTDWYPEYVSGSKINRTLCWSILYVFHIFHENPPVTL